MAWRRWRGAGASRQPKRGSPLNLSPLPDPAQGANSREVSAKAAPDEGAAPAESVLRAARPMTSRMQSPIFATRAASYRSITIFETCAPPA
jgi:hypothetical protein